MAEQARLSTLAHSVGPVGGGCDGGAPGMVCTPRLARFVWTTVAASATFVELTPLPVPTHACDCVIEIEAPGGGRMRVQVKGMADPVALGRVVWSGEA